MGFLSEDRKDEGLAASMTIADNLTLSNLKGAGPGAFVLPEVQHAQTRQWIDALNIRCQGSGQTIRNLSGGNQQKVALGRLLFHDVDILLLDEPTRGIDVGAKAMIYQVLDDLITRNPSKAIIVVSSYLPELMGICDRIAVMRRGELGQPYEVGEVSEHQLMEEAVSQSRQSLKQSFNEKK
jgi:ribose transport system ATP-binding protein